MFRRVDIAWTCNESVVNAFASDSGMRQHLYRFVVSLMTLSAVARKDCSAPDQTTRLVGDFDCIKRAAKHYALSCPAAND